MQNVPFVMEHCGAHPCTFGERYQWSFVNSVKTHNGSSDNDAGVGNNAVQLDVVKKRISSVLILKY